MKRRFITAFVSLFALFAVGIGASIFLLWRSSEELQRALHQQEVQELRHTLSLRIQRSKEDLEISGTVFANKLDDIVANVQALDDSVRGCLGCHHRPGPHGDLQSAVELVDLYKSQYSTFITASMNSERRQRLQLEASATAEDIELLVSGFMTTSSALMESRTTHALTEVDRTWKLLALTLISTFLAAFLVSSFLIRSVTGPLTQLSLAAERISAGELGGRIEHQEKHEIGALMNTFNEMSQALASNQERLDGHLSRLSRLNRAVFSLRATPETGAILPQLTGAMDDLVEAEYYGDLLRSDMDDILLFRLTRPGATTPTCQVAISASRVERLRAANEGTILTGSVEDPDRWPFGDLVPEISVKRFLISWIELQGELVGALIAVNKLSGEFGEEDGELLTALGHGVAEAMENIRRYQSLRHEMEEIRAKST